MKDKYKYKDIALALGISESKIKNIVSKVSYG